MKGDLSLVAYRNIRLSFGLRASPAILMLSLYKILCLDCIHECDQIVKFKKLLYALIYMEYGAFTGSAEEVSWAYQNLSSVFAPYQFSVQQIVTNVPSVQSDADSISGEVTSNEVKLLGLCWDRNRDIIRPSQICLDAKASTKRLILSIASLYDVFGIQGPVLNRARLFLHGLQCNESLSWDEKLNTEKLSEWKLIAKQASASGRVQIDRNFGGRDDAYDLVCFADSSRSIYAAVVYIKNLRTGKVSFIKGKNRIVNKQLEVKNIPTKTIPSGTYFSR